METEHRLGYQLELARGLNTLIQTSGHSLTEVHRVVGAIARGDLTQRIDADFHGTFGAIKEASNATAERLADVVGRISSASFAISAAAEEIARGNANLSLRTEAQAAGLQTTASSMEELTATVKQNAQSAKQASQLALSASDVATDGGRVVEEVIRTMASISDASTRIADIISVIDGIAFQTNILALNAAVEAARAGEQGRGFAVVATEVRSLAQRSAAAAREIKDLIGNSTDKVEAGSKLVSTAGQTMIEVVSSVKRVSDIINEITAASEEQSAGIEQVNQAIAQMDQTTQQNAVLVEDAGAAARAMASQAQDLDAAVSVFERVGTQDPPKRHKGVRLAA
jgi:methyl-accepting chemotaxis protein